MPGVIPDFLECTKCKINKPLNIKYFKKGKKNIYGFRPICKECTRIEQQIYRQKNKNTLIQKRRLHYTKIQDKVKLWNSISKKNKKIKMLLDLDFSLKIKKTYNERHMYRYRNDVLYKLRHRLRGRLRQVLKKQIKKSKFFDYIGCSLEELKIHIEKTFKPGMKWENHGEWHIDHIIPLTAFDLSINEELLKACHYSNLQALWAKDNIKKSNKII